MKYREITISGKVHPFHLGTMAVNRYCEAQDYTLGDLIAKFQSMVPKDGDEVTASNIGFSMSELLELLYQGLRDGYRKAKKDFNLTREDVADMCDEEAGLLLKVVPLFSQSITTVFGGESESDEDEGNAKPQAKRKAEEVNG